MSFVGELERLNERRLFFGAEVRGCDFLKVGKAFLGRLALAVTEPVCMTSCRCSLLDNVFVCHTPPLPSSVSASFALLGW